jgi:hypothetical protein
MSGIEKRTDLKEIIFENLREETSISALARTLDQMGIRINRLELSGFLKGLAAVGLLRIRIVRPCLLFSYQPVEVAPQVDHQEAGKQ